jgi:hypothetical protein
VVASGPLHAPEAEQAFALVEFHANVAVWPFATCVGLADNVTEGLGAEGLDATGTPAEAPGLALVGCVTEPHATNPASVGIKTKCHLKLKYCMLPRAMRTYLSMNRHLRSDAAQ